jgi:hypothetical protein
VWGLLFVAIYAKTFEQIKQSHHYFINFIIKSREKYILAPQTTTLSLDGPPNYQCLDSGPPNYHFLIFWPHPSIYAVNFKQNSENTPPTL